MILPALSSSTGWLHVSVSPRSGGNFIWQYVEVSAGTLNGPSSPFATGTPQNNVDDSSRLTKSDMILFFIVLTSFLFQCRSLLRRIAAPVPEGGDGCVNGKIIVTAEIWF